MSLRARFCPALIAAVMLAAPARAGDDRPTFVPRPARTMGIADSIAEAVKIAQGNRVGMTLTNYGFFGNNFVDRSASLEYPIGSGIEHLARSGIWIGAHAIDSVGAFTGVSSAVHDGSYGFTTGPNSEFTAAGTQIFERSSDPLSPWYTMAAVSPHDYVTTYSDRPGGSTTLNNEDHRPLNLLVKQDVYTWPWPSLDDILFVRFRIVNLGASALTGVHVGFYTEFGSGDKNHYTCWPPSSGCSNGYGGWYSKAWYQYDAGLRMLREHYCAGQPMPSACQLQRAPQWIGLQLLTPPTSGQKVTLAGWQWDPLGPNTDTDVERYALMSAGTIIDLTDPDYLPLTGDPVEMLCLGPFASIAPGDSITVDYAFVGGAEIADIQANAAKAQQVRDADFDAASPVTVALMSAAADPDRVWVSWLLANGARADVERTDDGVIWTGRGTYSANGSGLITFEDRDVVPGARYGYRLRIGNESAGETWIDVPQASGLAIRGMTPNPTRGAAVSVALSVPRPGAVAVELVDVTGRVVSRGSWTLAAGARTIRLPNSDRLPPGVYLVRLAQGTGRAESRLAITR